jgi:hypothetical protein
MTDDEKVIMYLEELSDRLVDMTHQFNYEFMKPYLQRKIDDIDALVGRLEQRMVYEQSDYVAFIDSRGVAKAPNLDYDDMLAVTNRLASNIRQED